jgi:hypothetical protein
MRSFRVDPTGHGAMLTGLFATATNGGGGVSVLKRFAGAGKKFAIFS